jgi:hypothetical protein
LFDENDDEFSSYVKEGRAKIIVPQGFTEAYLGENVLAGPAMARRAAYQFGFGLPIGPKGIIDSGLGKVSRGGTSSFLPPTNADGGGRDECGRVRGGRGQDYFPGAIRELFQTEEGVARLELIRRAGDVEDSGFADVEGDSEFCQVLFCDCVFS